MILHIHLELLYILLFRREYIHFRRLWVGQNLIQEKVIRRIIDILDFILKKTMMRLGGDPIFIPALWGKVSTGNQYARCIE